MCFLACLLWVGQNSRYSRWDFTSSHSVRMEKSILRVIQSRNHYFMFYLIWLFFWPWNKREFIFFCDKQASFYSFLPKKYLILLIWGKICLIALIFGKICLILRIFGKKMLDFTHFWQNIRKFTLFFGKICLILLIFKKICVILFLFAKICLVLLIFGKICLILVFSCLKISLTRHFLSWFEISSILLIFSFKYTHVQNSC